MKERECSARPGLGPLELLLERPDSLTALTLSESERSIPLPEFRHGTAPPSHCRRATSCLLTKSG